MFIVLEGVDGSGKSTQIANLQRMFAEQGIPTEYLHFPRFDAPYFGDLIARFLRGELGSIEQVDPYIVAMLYAGDRRDAAAMIRGWMEEGKVVIFACGLGQPFFSTDTAAVLRAAEIDADAVLMAKNIDGIYSADPKLDPTAVRYDEISYKEVLDKELKALDLSATTFCMENDIRCYAFALNDPDNIYRVVMGEHIGTELHR